MALVTNFERDQSGKYLSIEQTFNGEDIPEGSTFVAFDSVEFARSTGQIAIAEMKCGAVKGEGSLLNVVDNRDERWLLNANILDDKTLSFQYIGLGRTMIEALVQRGIENPELTAGCLRVKQRVDEINNFEYIGDGPIDLVSTNRYDDGTLPAPYSDVGITQEGGFRIAVQANINPNDHLL